MLSHVCRKKISELIDIVFREVSCKCRHPIIKKHLEAFDLAVHLLSSRLQKVCKHSRFVVMNNGQDMFVFADHRMSTCKEEAPAASLLSQPAPMESDKHVHHQLLHSCK